MTDKKRAALQAALERLEHLEFNKPHVRGTDDCHEDIIEEIRAALDEDEDAPPRRKWQSLTDEEKLRLNDSLNLQGRYPIIDAIQSVLEAKNK